MKMDLMEEDGISVDKHHGQHEQGVLKEDILMLYNSMALKAALIC